jgi:hypothetical protein
MDVVNLLARKNSQIIFFVENFSFAGLAGAAEGADRWPRSRRRPWQSKLKKKIVFENYNLKFWSIF